MFRKIQQHIYKQPRSVRDTYAFTGAVICTGLVALVWLSTGAPFSGGDATDTVAQTPAAEQTSAQPFSRMFDSVQEGVRTRWASVQESVAPVSEEAGDAGVDAPASREPAESQPETATTSTTTRPARPVQIATSSPAVATTSSEASTTSSR